VRGTTVRAHTRRLGGSEHVLTKLALLAVLFVVVSIWVDPEGTAEQVGAFLAGAGRFVLEVLAVAAAFLGSLARAS
jgi:uncharacterized membrane protein YkgB